MGSFSSKYPVAGTSFVTKNETEISVFSATTSEPVFCKVVVMLPGVVLKLKFEEPENSRAEPVSPLMAVVVE